MQLIKLPKIKIDPIYIINHFQIVQKYLTKNFQKNIFLKGKKNKNEQ